MKKRSAHDLKLIRSLLVLLTKKDDVAHVRRLVRAGAALAPIAMWVLEYVRGPEGFAAEQRYFKRLLATKGWDVAHESTKARMLRLAPPAVRAVLATYYAKDAVPFVRRLAKGDRVRILAGKKWSGALATVEQLYEADGQPNLESVAKVASPELGTSTFAVRYLQRLDAPKRAA